jgi:hypothetical protein
VLVGLASKNAILIVEFARQQRRNGKSRLEATLEACTLRLRPIIMTSFAFILGVLPLIVSHGAGAEMRRTLGTAVFSGMLGVTLFGVVLTPVFFYSIDWLGDSRMFSSRAARFLGRIVLDVLRLGIVWRVIRGALSRIAAASKSRPQCPEAQPSPVDAHIDSVSAPRDVIAVSTNGANPAAGTDSNRIGPPGSPASASPARVNARDE